MRSMFEIGQTLRDSIAAYYDDISNGLVGTSSALPARRLVDFGLPAADCELLAVSIESWTPISGTANAPAFTDDRDEVAFNMRAMVAGIWIFRCVPLMSDDGDPPSVDDMENATMAITLDAQYVEAAIKEALADGELPGCGGIAFVGWTAITPLGDLGGSVLRLNISLE